MAVANTQQKFEIAVPGTVDSVFDAVMSVVNGGKYKSIEPQPLLKMVSFRSGASMMTWGQRWMVQVVRGADGQANVTATVTPRNGGQQLDAARIAKIANEFYQNVATTVTAES